MLKRILSLTLSLIALTSIITGCAKTAADEKKGTDKITIVWYPNESGKDLEGAREEITKIVEKATGKTVDNKLTTDYNIAIESIANGSASIAFMGAEGYVQANKKNKNVVPLVTNSDAKGTLDGAMYNSWIAVKKEDTSKYQKDGKFSIDNVQGKIMSFVSNSSTSGFKVPTSGIISHFSSVDKWKNLKTEDLATGGSDKFFTQVLFGNSHQGSAVNLLSGKADVAAFSDAQLANYIELKEGKENTAGAVYKIKQDAADPFKTLGGKEFTVISNTPVLNDPFVMNKDVLTADEQKKLVDAFTSDEVAKNEKIFIPKGSEFKGMFKKTGNEKFVKVEDSWYDPIRALSK